MHIYDYGDTMHILRIFVQEINFSMYVGGIRK